MIPAPLAKILLQQVAIPLFNRHFANKVRLFGSSLRNPATGQVMGYLQARDTIGAMGDTAKLLGAIPLLFNPYTAPAGAAYMVGKTGLALFDTQRTAHRIEDKLGAVTDKLGEAGRKLDGLGEGLQEIQTTSLAGIGLQVLDIGLNVANFEKVNLRLEDISSRVAAVDEAFRTFQESQLALAFTELRTLARALDEGWRLSGSAAENRWHEVAARSLHVQDQFETRARSVLNGPGAYYMSADALIDAVSFANGLRVSALGACNQTTAAIEAAADGARVLDSLTGHIGVADMARALLDQTGVQRGTQDYTVAFASSSDAARAIGLKIRQREANAVTRAEPLAALEQHGVRPRDWLESVRAAEDTALIYMEASLNVQDEAAV